jgi:UDP-N-acetylmuramate dehydrogenase
MISMGLCSKKSAILKVNSEAYSMLIYPDISLQPYNTFGLNSIAKGLIHILTEKDIQDVIAQNIKPIKILGGGSNILLTKDVDAYILKNEIKGIEAIKEDDEQILIKVGAGEQWHNFVLWTLDQNLGGLENLSLIPGSVGAAPMQNIGAYGVEQESSFYSLEAINLKDGTNKIFNKEDCKFAYRESVFKNELKDQYFITSVCYTLSKKNHVLHLDYGAIKEVMALRGITQPCIHDISEAVIEIRKSKLPDPKIVGNAGSFFKNPVIPASHFENLKSRYNDIPSYPADEGKIKIPAGWLIEKVGFKGKTFGNVGVHKDQALVLVNYGGGDGKKIYEIALLIKDQVKNIFGVELSPEVNIW